MKIWTTLVIIGILGLCGTAAAVPPMPSEFYGDLSINGNPAPAGTEIRALIDGEERGVLITSVDGSYGGTETFDERLVVTLGEEEAGATIVFEVDGEEAEETAVAEPGAVQRLDLSVGSPTAGTPTLTPAGGSSGAAATTTAPGDEEEQPVTTASAPTEAVAATTATTAVPATTAADDEQGETGGEATPTQSTPLLYAPFLALAFALLLAGSAHRRR